MNDNAQRLRQRWNLSALNLLAVVLALGLLVVFSTRLNSAVDDFKHYWHGSVSLHAHGDPYRASPADPAAPSYLYPPLLAVLLLPLSQLPQADAQRVWYAINVGALGFLIWLAIRSSHSQLARRYWGVVTLFVLVAPPTVLGLHIGQIGIIIALLLVAGFALVGRNAPAAGFLFALASCIKLYPGLMIVHALTTRLYRVVMWSAVMGAVLLSVPVVMYGISPYTSYVAKVLLSHPYAAEANISITGFWRRLLVANAFADSLVDEPALAAALVILSDAAVTGVCLWIVRGRQRHGHCFQFSAWLCAMSLLSPFNGYYNLVLLVLPALVVLHYLEQRCDRGVWAWLLIGTALVLIPPTWTDWQPWLYGALHARWGVLLLTPSFYGLLIYFVLLSTLAHRETRAEARPA